MGAPIIYSPTAISTFIMWYGIWAESGGRCARKDGYINKRDSTLEEQQGVQYFIISLFIMIGGDP